MGTSRAPASSGNFATGKNAIQNVHGIVDQAAEAAEDVIGKVKPAVGHAAAYAHDAVDKAAGVAASTARWASSRANDVRETQRQVLARSRKYVASNPLKAVGIAVVAGLIIGRFM